MKNLHDPAEAVQYVSRYPDLPPDLAIRIYTSRLLGRDPDLVLHGGGNTSVKIRQTDLWGREIDRLYVKGSGVDLAGIEPEGFAVLDLARLQALVELTGLSDQEIEDELSLCRTRLHRPEPSVDTWVHAVLPHRFVDHTHADAILILANQTDGPEILAELLGPTVAVIPYVKPGIGLGRAVGRLARIRPELTAVVVIGHGIFTFADQAQTAYDRMIECVSLAQARVDTDLQPTGSCRMGMAPAPPTNRMVARLNQVLRGTCSYPGPDGRPTRLLATVRSEADLLEAAASDQADWLCSSGMLTPDHVTRTKNRAVHLGRPADDDHELSVAVRAAVQAYAAEYDLYYHRHAGRLSDPPARLDPHPRVFLVEGVGLVALGPTRAAAQVAADIAVHNVRAKLKGHALGRYQPLSEDHVFDLEYWPPQLRKMASGRPSILAGQIALVTGGGGAIGLGIADRLLAAGATVALADLDRARLARVREILEERYPTDHIEAMTFDVTDFEAVSQAVDDIGRRLGGLDILVPNAGIAHVATIEELDPARLDQVLAVNLRGTFNVIKAATPVFRRQGTGGNVVIVSSKNVFDPGAAFGAYSAAKAGAHQLGKIAALELAQYGVKVNMVNPDAVFGDEKVSSQLWDVVGPDRMRARGLDPEGLKEYYRQRNLLRTRVTAGQVGQAVVFFASDLTPTTGATLPVDGGVPGAFPR